MARDDQPGSWTEWSRYVLKELDDLNKKADALHKKADELAGCLDKMRTQIVVVRLKTSLWAGLVGAASALLAAIAIALLKKMGAA